MHDVLKAVGDHNLEALPGVGAIAGELELLAAIYSDAPGPWLADAACVGLDPEPFFAPAHGRAARWARAVCLGCDVMPQCREYATSRPDIHGTWGATSLPDRKQARAGSVA